MWKVWRILKFRVLWKGWIPVIYVRDQAELPCMHCGVTPLPSPSPLPLPHPQRDQRTALEEETGRFDMQAIGYLSYLMLPLVVGGAVYSLVYNTHKRSVPLSCPLVLNWTSGRERSLLVPSCPVLQLVLLGHPQPREWGVCLWVPVHAPSALPQLPAQDCGPPALEGVYVQGVQS